MSLPHEYPKRGRYKIPVYDEITYYTERAMSSPPWKNPLFADAPFYMSSTGNSPKIHADIRRSYDGRIYGVVFKYDLPETTVYNWNHNVTVSTTQLSMPDGWHEAESQDIATRVEKSKKKKVAQVKDVKRLVMGPKNSRWK